MTIDEARQCVDGINASITNARVLLWELYTREGWKTLGYSSWRECVAAEFNQSQAYLYRQLKAAEIEQNISPIGEIGRISESRVRPLTALPPAQQAEAWQKAVETSNGKPTAKDVQAAVNDIKRPHVANNSGENEWYTPPSIIALARLTMGSIDLDPATTEICNTFVQAANIYTIETNGLSQPWYGNVWLNPPYAQPLIRHFCDKLVSERPNIKQACVLVNNATETAWFRSLLSISARVCLVSPRVKFVGVQGDSGAPLQGQIILYVGENVDAFKTHFSTLGIVLREA